MTQPPVQGFASIPRSMLHDPSVPRDAKLVYLVLSSHVGGNQMAWPSHKRMADLLDCSLSTVKRQLAWLRDHGYVRWDARAAEDGTQTTNSYTLLVGSAPSPAEQGGSVRTGRGSDRPGGVSQRATPRGPTDLPPRSQRATNESHMNESHRNDRSAAPPRGVDAIFDQFWAVYPRREAKGAAKVALAKALRKGVEAEAILAGARRLAADPNLPDRQFIPHPTTWLNQGRWEDEPLPPRTDGRRPERPQRRPDAGLTVSLPIESGAG